MANAQTSPTPQALPYVQDFNSLSHSANVYPSGWQGWQVTTTLGSTFNTSAPTADKALNASGSASTTAGNVHNYNGKIGFLNSGSSGDLSIALAINTTGKSGIELNYDVMTIRNPYDGASNTRINEVTLQYRVGSSGAFTNLTGIEYQNNTTQQTTSGSTTPQNISFKTITLPSQCENQSVVELRWISRQVSGAGSRPSFAIDNISIDEVNSKIIGLASTNDATEGASPVIGAYELTFNPATDDTTSFTYSISGTAIFGTDFTISLNGNALPGTLSSTTGTIVVPDSTTSIMISVVPINDNLPEGSETVKFSISNPTDDYQFGGSEVTLTINDDDPIFIHKIQGSGTNAVSGKHIVEAIVTGVYPGLSPSGFYIQEEDADMDSNDSTSEGLFVVSNATVAVGDKVRVSGTVQENGSSPSFGQAVIHTATVAILSSGNSLPSFKVINLPFSSLSEFEFVENMLVHFPDELTVTDNFNLGRFGEIRLSAGGLVYQPTQIIDVNDSMPSGTNASGNSNLAAINALSLSNTLRTVLLDDGTGVMTTLPYVDTTNNLRIGSKACMLKGIMGYGFSNYRIQPIPSAWPKFKYAERPAIPSVGKSNLKVTSFNVLNYFNGNGNGTGFPTSRGAHSIAEFNRQRTKIIQAIAQIDADVVGLTEIENDGTDSNSAIVDLVNGLNTMMGAGTYDFIRDGSVIQWFGTDAIKCAIIYKPSTVKPQGRVMVGSDNVFNRPPVAQTFTLLSTCSDFNYVINHFKSKGSTGAIGADKDQSDGQGAYNATRKLQSSALVEFIKDSVISRSACNRVISMGDYNAYFEEDPLDVLRDSGYKVLSNATSFSYQFSGQLGSLDHALVNKAISPFVTGVAKWNLNASEPTHLGYEDNINDGSGDFVNQWSSTYSNIPFRSSDHDPVIVGLRFKSELPQVNLNIIPSSNVFTGGRSNIIYLGYGPQSDTIAIEACKGSGFKYQWTPSDGLSCDTCKKTAFAPDQAGRYSFELTTTSDKGCKVVNSIDFCVKDIRVPGKSNKVYVCHNGNTLSISTNAVASHLKKHKDDELGRCDDNSCREKRDCDKRSLLSEVDENEKLLTSIEVYPNPVLDYLNINLPEEVKNANVTLTDMNGKVILVQSLLNGLSQIDIGTLPQGVFVLQIEMNGNVNRLMLVKQ